jgi:hypothetical protein
MHLQFAGFLSLSFFFSSLDMALVVEGLRCVHAHVKGVVDYEKFIFFMIYGL